MSQVMTDALFDAALRALKYGEPADVEKAFAALTNLDAQDQKHGTLLHWAVHFNDVASAKLLLDRGAGVNVRANGVTPLRDVAPRDGDKRMLEMLRLLLDAGADPNAGDDAGCTLMMKLCMRAEAPSFAEIVLPAAQLLFDHGLDANARDEGGSTALGYAAAAGRADVVKLLLEHGADPHARAWWWDGKRTPRELAKGADVKALLTGAEEATRPRPEPPHGTTIEKLRPSIARLFGKMCRMRTKDERLFGDCLTLTDERRVTFFDWSALGTAAQKAFRAQRGKRMSPTMIPFALVGSPAMHKKGATIEGLGARAVFGTLFWDLELGVDGRCAYFFWCMPGSKLPELVRVGSSLDVLDVEEL
jgi:ankyrin repeat protein